MSETSDYTQEQIDLLKAARLGIELRDAQNSLFYRWLMEMARIAALDAASALVTVDPTDWRAVAAQQAEVKRLSDIKSWVDQAIQRGLQAEHAFDEGPSGHEGDDHGTPRDQGDES